MEKVNYDLIESLIGTQYTDMKGFAAIDGHFPTTLWKLCNDNGIDTKNWFLIGLEFSDGETVGRYGARVAAYLVEKIAPEENYEQVAARLECEAEVSVHVKHFTVPYNRLGEYIKRIDIGVFTSMTNSIRSMKLIDE